MFAPAHPGLNRADRSDSPHMLAMKKKARRTQMNYRYAALGIFSSVPLSFFLAATPARAQLGLTDAMNDEAAAQARARQEGTQYTIKSGDFRMLLQPSLSLQFNDNINLTQSGKQDDFIILPDLGIIMSYPLSDRNLLQLDVTVGYQEYVKHSSLSSFYLQSGSQLSFDVYIKDILINLHDSISYVQNSAQNAQVAGTGTYGTFLNTAGVSAQWNLRYLDITAGFDHGNTIATSSQFSDNDNSTESGDLRLGYKWNSKLTTGVEGSIAYTGYSHAVLNNNTSYSGGLYGDWHPDEFLHVEPRIGYEEDQFANNSQDLQTSNQGSWYADLNISHQITRSINYSIDIGRNVGLGVQSDANEYWYVNSSLTWNFIRNFSFAPTVFFQHGTQGQGTTVLAPGMTNPNLLQQTEVYNWYGGSISFNYAITKRFDAGVNYTITERTSDVAGRGYTQNVIGISISYHPI
jgi:hypothetical protein